MRIWREVFQTKRVTVLLVLALIAATIWTVVNSRPSYAEGSSLLGPVRCLVRTVLTAECPSPASPETQSRADSPARNTAGSTSGAPGKTPTTSQQAGSPSERQSTDTGSTYGEAIAAPSEPIVAYTPFEEVRSQAVPKQRIHQSEYIAYFNKYSPYAVAGEQEESSEVVQQTHEGWRVMGVAWYWWMALALLFVAVFASFKRQLDRKAVLLRDVE